jgi:hypothetical protein
MNHATKTAPCGCKITRLDPVETIVVANGPPKKIHAVSVVRCKKCTSYVKRRNSFINAASAYADTQHDKVAMDNKWSRCFLKKMDRLMLGET